MVALADIRVGQTVRLDHGIEGRVVFNSVSGEFSHGYSRADWGYLDPGVMLMTRDAGLVFHPADTISGPIEIRPRTTGGG